MHGNLAIKGLTLLDAEFENLIAKGNTVSPESLETFKVSCICNFLCLQMISFEFLRVASIG